MTKTIYISAYPKSGSTWLTNLLGDTLNSPTGGNRPQDDHKEIATNLNRPGPYFIRKGHYKLVDWHTRQIVPRPHHLNWQMLDNQKVIFLVRDPRDICISGAYHWNCEQKDFLNRMITGNIMHLSRWDNYVSEWLDILFTPAYKDIFILIRYEDLIQNPAQELDKIISFIPEYQARMRIKQAIHNQSFEQRRIELLKADKSLKTYNMRKGIAGDWRNHFTSEMKSRIIREFGEVMGKLNYEI